jgi:hypothetical protein
MYGQRNKPQESVVNDRINFQDNMSMNNTHGSLSLHRGTSMSTIQQTLAPIPFNRISSTRSDFTRSGNLNSFLGLGSANSNKPPSNNGGNIFSPLNSSGHLLANTPNSNTNLGSGIGNNNLMETSIITSNLNQNDGGINFNSSQIIDDPNSRNQGGLILNKSFSV